MDKITLQTLISNIGTPAFVSDIEGTVLMKNKYMKFICKQLSASEFKRPEDLPLVFGEEKNDDVIAFSVDGLNQSGFRYKVKINSGDELFLYIFDKAVATDRMVTNVMEHIDEIVVIFNKDGVIERMNSLCDQILPFKRKDVIGKNIMQLVEKKIVDDPIMIKLIETKKKIYKDITYPNGKIISYTAIPIFGSEGNFRGGVLTGRDISRIVGLAKNAGSEDSKDIEYISVSKAIEDIKKIIARVAPSEASVFIIGESGVGKEIITRSIWSQSLRRDEPFVAINCASIPSELIESELFGYEKGAFTGANKEGKIGLIEAANGGTLFLDEIGELPLETQKKLLRVLQENSIMRIGGIEQKKVDVRFISATNKTLKELQDPAVFRQDLFYRLSVIPITVPPLRERRDDVLPICNYYIKHFNEKYNRQIKLSKEAETILINNKWLGNIRELKNVMERLVILSAQDNIYADQIERMVGLDSINSVVDIKKTTNIQDDRQDVNGNVDSKIVVNELMTIEEAHKIVEQEIIQAAVLKYGNVTRAAEAVGINASTIYRKVKSGFIQLDNKN
ncbi:MAG: sigma 54-interacting transcriptional regulator [Anaerovoracaceae bacterium]